MKQSKHFNHNGVQISRAGLVIHGKVYPMENIKSFRLAESNTQSSIGVLFMLIGLLLLVEEGEFFVFGGFLMFAGVLLRFAHDPAYSLLITTSEGEKAVLTSRDTLYMNKIIKALEISISEHWQQSNSLNSEFGTALPHHRIL